MIKQDLIEIIAEEHAISKALAGRVIDSIFNNIKTTVIHGDTFQMVGFGSFKAIGCQARQGRNPHTGEVVEIAATTVPKFVPGSAFKAAVAK